MCRDGERQQKAGRESRSLPNSSVVTAGAAAAGELYSRSSCGFPSRMREMIGPIGARARLAMAGIRQRNRALTPAALASPGYGSPPTLPVQELNSARYRN